MNSFYEKHRDDNASIHISRSRPHTYPSHFHQSVEIYILAKGEYLVNINGAEHRLSGGDIAFIDSYDIHSFEEVDAERDDCVLIIPFKLLGEFNKLRYDRQLSGNIISDPKLVCRILMLVDDVMTSGEGEEAVDSAARLILALLYGRLSFSDVRERGEASLVRSILSYIQLHYREDLTRYTISRALGYTPEHISRVFNKYVKSGLNRYINALRISYINERLSRGDAPSLRALIYEAGFNSEHTYYRSKALLGFTYQKTSRIEHNSGDSD